MRYRIHNLVLLLSLLVGIGGGLSATSAEATNCTQAHTVQAGENLYRIALRYQKTVGHLQALNGISNANQIYVGQRICINGGIVVTPPTPQPTSEVGTVVVSYLNVRNGPGIQYSIVRVARYGETFTVQGRSADGRWVKVSISGGPGAHAWVAAQYVRVVGVPGNGQTGNMNVPVVASGYIYNGPGWDYGTYGGTVYAGMTIQVIGRNADALWIKVLTDQGTGWVNVQVFPAALDRFGLPQVS